MIVQNTQWGIPCQAPGVSHEECYKGLKSMSNYPFKDDEEIPGNADSRLYSTRLITELDDYGPYSSYVERVW